MISAVARTFKLFLFVIITLVFLAFAIANRNLVKLSLFPLPYSVEVPEFLFAIACFSAGAIVGWLLLSSTVMRSRRLLKSEHKRVMALQNEVGVLRTGKHETQTHETLTALPRS